MGTSNKHKEILARSFSMEIPPDYSPEDSTRLSKYGEWFLCLTSRDIFPFTQAQEKFIKTTQGILKPLSSDEILWNRFLDRIAPIQSRCTICSIRLATKDKHCFTCIDEINNYCNNIELISNASTAYRIFLFHWEVKNFENALKALLSCSALGEVYAELTLGRVYLNAANSDPHYFGMAYRHFNRGRQKIFESNYLKEEFEKGCTLSGRNLTTDQKEFHRTGIDSSKSNDFFQLENRNAFTRDWLYRSY